jgi:hypothetical protein
MKNLVMKIYKEHYMLIEDSSTYDITKTFNDVQSHIFSIGKKWHVQKENEFDEYLKIPVASIDINVLLWWKVSLFFRKNRLDFYKQIYI